MKRWTSLLALALVLAVGAGVAQAKGNKADKAGKVGKKDHDAVAGKVVSATATSITIQTAGKKGAEVTITVDASTQYKGVASATDLKPGMKITVTPATGTATKVVVHEKGEKGDTAGKNGKKKDA
jgi:hypothetical protein